MPRICKDNCQWRLYTKFEACNKSCTGKFCPKHKYLYKKGGRTYACTGCGKGIRNVFKVCIPCGYYSIWRRNAIEKKFLQ